MHGTAGAHLAYAHLRISGDRRTRQRWRVAEPSRRVAELSLGRCGRQADDDPDTFRVSSATVTAARAAASGSGRHQASPDGPDSDGPDSELSGRAGAGPATRRTARDASS